MLNIFLQGMDGVNLLSKPISKEVHPKLPRRKKTTSYFWHNTDQGQTIKSELHSIWNFFNIQDAITIATITDDSKGPVISVWWNNGHQRLKRPQRFNVQISTIGIGAPLPLGLLLWFRFQKTKDKNPKL